MSIPTLRALSGLPELSIFNRNPIQFTANQAERLDKRDTGLPHTLIQGQKGHRYALLGTPTDPV